MNVDNMKPPFPPKSESDKPADPKAPPAGGAPDPDALLADAEAGGKLDPLKQFLASEGRDDLDAKELLKLAQKDDRTKGKTPADLVKMLGEDPALLDDLFEYRDGGMFSKPKGEMPPMKDEETSEDEKPSSGSLMSDEM